MSLKKKIWRAAYDVYGRAGGLFKPVEDQVVSRVERATVGIAGGTRPVPGHTLYHFQLSPFSYRVRSAIRRLGLSIPMRDVLLDHEAFRELVKQGGKDQVPCLRIDEAGGTRWLYESKDIVAYLESIAADGAETER